MKGLQTYATAVCASLALLAANAFSQSAESGGDQAPAVLFPKRAVALAFLGSRLKFKTEIAPLLRKYNFHATLFIDDPPPPKVDNLGTGMGPMTSDEIKEVTDVFEIGNFTAHPEDDLGDWLSWPRAEQLRQLADVEQRCQAAGIPKPSLLFYPSGMEDAAIFQQLADDGYSMGLVRLPPHTIDFYKPAIYHPFLVPCLFDMAYFYGAIDQVREPDFPRDRILVLAFDESPMVLGWGRIDAYLKYLYDRKFTVLSIGDLAGYADAAEAMRAKRYWDMRYATGGGFSGLVFTWDRFSRHWYMDKMTPTRWVSVPDPPPDPPRALTPLEAQLESRILPKVDFDNLPLKDCIEALREPPADGGGNAMPVNFVLSGGVDEFTPITLHLVHVPMMEVIRYLSDLAGARYVADTYAITLSPKTGNRPARKTPAAFTEIAALDDLNLSEVHYTAASLGSALEALRHKAQSGSAVNIPDFVIEPGVNLSTPVTLRLVNAPYTEVLRYIGRLAGVGFSIERYAISVTAGPNPDGDIGPVTPASMTESVDVETTSIPRLDFTEASLDSVMDLLSGKLQLASGGAMRLPFVSDPTLDLSVPVTLHVRNIPFTEALRYVADMANVDFKIERYAIFAGHKTAPAAQPAPQVYVAPTPFALVHTR